MSTNPISTNHGTDTPQGLDRRLNAALQSLGGKISARSAAKRAQEQEAEEATALLGQADAKECHATTELSPYREQLDLALPPAQKVIPGGEAPKVVLLTPWSDDKRAAPNAIFRSALFPALNNKQGRKFLKEQKLYSVGGLEVMFTGEQFDQTDLDVYLEILNFAKGMPLGQPVRFSAYAMLKVLGRCTGKSDHKWLHAVLVRLRSGTVELLTGKARYFGGLIESGFKDEISKHYEVTLNPNYAVLFGFGMWSAIDREQRRALVQNSTAKALHAYYSTHISPSLHRYETLASIVGLGGKNRRDVKASLIRAHEELKRIGFLLDYEAKESGIEVKAIMTPGQQQHALKKLTKTRRNPIP